MSFRIDDTLVKQMAGACEGKGRRRDRVDELEVRERDPQRKIRKRKKKGKKN